MLHTRTWLVGGLGVLFVLFSCGGESPTETAEYKELERELARAQEALDIAQERLAGSLPPARPRGVSSISGDGEVTVVWFANEEPNLAGYEIWRSLEAQSGYGKLATLGPSATTYTDDDVVNGRTYYYALLAFDDGGNESDLSPELVEDTPRPEGSSVTLANYRINPGRSGFTFSEAKNGPRDWDRDVNGLLDRDVDVFFGFDTEVNVPYIYSDHEDMFMQDVGYHDDMDAVDVAPMRGFTIIAVEMLEGHVYAFYTPDARYAKIRTTQVSELSVTFDWAIQLQQNNPDLAPSRHPNLVTRGQPASRGLEYGNHPSTWSQIKQLTSVATGLFVELGSR